MGEGQGENRVTAGSYIKKLLEDKQVSISWLSKQMGIKSRSTFYRLFNDYYSKDKTGELIDRKIGRAHV